MKHALIDVGSNSIRLSVYRGEGDAFERLFSEKEMAGLVNYMQNGVLTQEGIDAACQILSGFQTLLKQFDLNRPQVFATASLRNIGNTQEAVEKIFQKTGIFVDVISGEEEARLGCCGALHSISMNNGYLFDLGGGSTEVVGLHNGKIASAQSIPVGSLTLFKGNVTKIFPKTKEQKQINEIIAKELETLPDEKKPTLCGVGGTARAMLKLMNHLHKRTGRFFSAQELNELTQFLQSRSTQARDLILKKCPDRIHTILPGSLLMNALAKRLGSDTVAVSEYGVREGYLCQKILPNTI